MADVPSYLPANPDDWTSVVGGKGGPEYRKDNPEYYLMQYAEMQKRQKYLEDLMRRQAPWTLNERLVGKGVPDDAERTGGLWGMMQPAMRGLSEATIGQPYGFMVPPRESDVKAANQAVIDAQERYKRSKMPAGLLGK